jgi:hypothetical protein
MDESSLSFEAVTPSPKSPSSQLSQCVVCKADLSGLSGAEREAHLNLCLDKDLEVKALEAEVSCSVCSKIITHLPAGARNAHVERCLEEEARKARPVSAAAAARAGGNRLDGPLYMCVVCNKDLSSASFTARGQHVKSCAKKSNTNALEMRSLVQGKTEAPKQQPLVKEVYHDPISGFTRTLRGSASASGLTGAQKDNKQQKLKRKKKKHRDDDLVVVGDDEELAQIALALAASLGPAGSQQLGSSGEQPKSDKGMPLHSLHLENAKGRSTDLAGFRVPTLTQVVNEVAPQIELADQYQLRTSKLSSSSNARSIWKKASERPNAEAGSYVAAERTPVLPSPSPVNLAAADARASAVSPDPTPAKRARRQNVLEIAADVEAEVRGALSTIGNAYSMGCREALERAEKQIQLVRNQYFASIGKCAIERDSAVEQLMARFALHPGHCDTLPMQP